MSFKISLLAKTDKLIIFIIFQKQEIREERGIILVKKAEIQHETYPHTRLIIITDLIITFAIHSVLLQPFDTSILNVDAFKRVFTFDIWRWHLSLAISSEGCWYFRHLICHDALRFNTAKRSVCIVLHIMSEHYRVLSYVRCHNVRDICN